MLRIASRGDLVPPEAICFFFCCFVGEVRLADLSMPERQFPKDPGPVQRSPHGAISIDPDNPMHPDKTSVSVASRSATPNKSPNPRPIFEE